MASKKSKQEQSESDSDDSFYSATGSTTEEEVDPNPPKKDVKDTPVEWTIKNLDTGEVIDPSRLPKGSSDPFASLLASKNMVSTGTSTDSPSKKEKKSKKWIDKLKPKKKKKPPLFAQIIRQKISEHTSAVWTMAFSFDGSYLASGGKDTHIRLWKVKDNEEGKIELELIALLKGHDSDILNLNWSHSRSNILISCALDKTVRLWDTKEALTEKFKESKKDLIAIKILPQQEVVTSVSFYPQNEELIVMSSLDGKIRFWNWKEGKIYGEIPTDATHFVTSLAITSSGTRMIYGSYDGIVCWLQLKDTGSTIHWEMLKYSGNRKKKKITGIQISPTDQNVLITSNDSRCVMYRISDFEPLCHFIGPKNYNFQIFASFSENGTMVVCGSENRKTFLWDCTQLKSNPLLRKTTAALLDTFAAHPEIVSCALFMPFQNRKSAFKTEGEILVTAGCPSGEMRLIELKKLEKKPAKKEKT